MLIPAIFEKFKVFSENASFFSEKPNFWEFWEIRLFRSHSTSNWLTSTAFKKFKFFSRKTICFLESKNWTFREILLIQSMLRQVCYLWPFNKNSTFFLRTYLFFKQKKQILNVLRIFSISFAFYSKFATFRRFWKVQDFSENLFMFLIKLKFFELFEKTSNFSCVLQQNSYL